VLSPTVHRTVVYVDVADFTNPSRKAIDLQAVQEGVYQVLETAFKDCGIDYGACDMEDRGDGSLILIPADVSKSKLADLLPDRLVAALRRYNAIHTTTAQIRLRVGIHAGDIRRNVKGWIGDAVNLAARIMNADEVKAALAESDGLVAWTVSDYFYNEVIRQDPGVAPEQYRPLVVSVKTFSGTIWLRLPGMTGPVVPVPRHTPMGQLVRQGDIPRDQDGLDVIPPEDLDVLHGWLAHVEVPHLPTLVARAVGPAIPPPRPTSAWGVFVYLSDFNAGPDGIPPALVFLKLLAREMAGEISTLVAAWVAQQTRRLRRTESLDQVEAGWGPIPENPTLHLMIVVQQDAVDTDRYVLSYWRQDDPEVWPPPLSGVHEVAVDELEYRVDDIILSAEEVWGTGPTASAVVEFVLPRNLLTLPVRQWRKEHKSGDPRPLIFDYQVRLRSLERMRALHWRRSWRLRWQTVVNHAGLDRIHPFGPTAEDKQIDAVLSDDWWLGLVLRRPPTPKPEPGDALTAAFRAGLPLICWHPAAAPEDLRKDVGWLLDHGFGDLPRRYRQVELSLGSNSNLVHDLVVMWEDPDRVISFDRPSTPNPQ